MSLTDDLIQGGYLKTPALIQAFRKIKRSDFLLPGDRNKADYDAPLTIGYGQTISQPATVAMMLELLKPSAGDKILDVGSGSGWTTALLANVVGKQGKVYGIERIAELKKFGQANVAKYKFIKEGRVTMLLGDGYAGLPQEAPFDKILVSAAAEEIPQKLLEQLKIGGRLVVPVGKQYQSQEVVVFIKKSKKRFEHQNFPGFVFVPLVKNWFLSWFNKNDKIFILILKRQTAVHILLIS